MIVVEKRTAGIDIGLDQSADITSTDLQPPRRPANTHAHHIVAQNDARAAASREILRRFGINADDAANGVFLPKPYHQ